MAIQTKKISELGSITSLEGEVYFLGTSAGVTGRISKSDLETNILKEVKDSIAQIKTDIETLKESVSAIASTPAPISSGCDCGEKIAALTEKIAKLEGFVQALQKNSYLTLAEVKKAAAEACPVSAE